MQHSQIKPNHKVDTETYETQQTTHTATTTTTFLCEKNKITNIETESQERHKAQQMPNYTQVNSKLSTTRTSTHHHTHQRTITRPTTTQTHRKP